jgi:hypothetical protein
MRCGRWPRVFSHATIAASRQFPFIAVALMAKKKKSSAPPPSNKMVQHVVRLAVGALLVILLLLAIGDMSKKRAAEATSLAWRTALASKSMMDELKKSELDAMIQGAPDRSECPKTEFQDQKLVQSAERFVWRGTFRRFEIRVGYSLGADPAVEVIDGIGAPVQ